MFALISDILLNHNIAFYAKKLKKVLDILYLSLLIFLIRRFLKPMFYTAF